jgi:hypothetical protein
MPIPKAPEPSCDELADELADKIEDLIAEFGDEPKAALQCVSEYLELRRHPIQEER